MVGLNQNQKGSFVQMTVTAIICEYNPFHNGHKYLIDEARRITNCDYIVAVMSGNYVQRGEPAIADKWVRSKIALECGADAVIEIPSIFSVGSAQFFAEAAIDLINKSGIVNYLAFGSETADIAELTKLGQLRSNEPAKFKELLKSNMKTGSSYPVAMEKALGIKLKSNDILAVEYIAALMRTKSIVKPIAIKRAGTSAHSDSNLPVEPSANYASATAIRNKLSQCSGAKGAGDISEYMPPYALECLSQALTESGGIPTLEKYSQIIFYELRKLKPEGIRNLPYVTEGYEYKLYEAASKSTTITELIDSCTSTRYTKTRVTRILTAILTGATSEYCAKFHNNLPYIRILGFKRDSSELISTINETAIIPVVIQPAKTIKVLSEDAKQLIGLESFATDNYMLGLSCNNKKTAGQEFTRPAVII